MVEMTPPKVKIYGKYFYDVTNVTTSERIYNRAEAEHLAKTGNIITASDNYEKE